MEYPLQIENFYLNPDKVREVALTQEYQPASVLGGNWPGIRTVYLNNIVPDIYQQFTERLYAFLGWPKGKSAYFETSFQICNEKDGDSWVHQDDFNQYTHIAMVFLQPNPQPNSGTLLYNIKEGISDEDGGKDWHYSDNNGNPDFYKVKKRFPNIYNSCILYGPSEWHKSDVYFGSSNDNARLTQVCFLREDYNRAETPHLLDPPANEDYTPSSRHFIKDLHNIRLDKYKDFLPQK